MDENPNSPLDNDYVMGPWAASAINFEVRKIFNVLNSKRRNVKVLRKSTMTKDEIKKLPGIIKDIQTVSRKNEQILNILGYREDKDRFYILTEARKVDSRVELQQEVFL